MQKRHSSMEFVRIAVAGVFLLGASTICSGAPSAEDHNNATRDARAKAEYEMFTDLTTALVATGKFARIYVHDDPCQVGELGWLVFPEMKFRAPAKGQKGLEAIRYMFGDDPHTEVSEDPSGMVRITIGKVSAELLGTKVHSLAFSQRAQYNPQLPVPDGSIDTILSAPEVKTVMAKLKVSTIGGFFEIIEAPPIETDPHLPPSMNDVTVDEALDIVARTFGGVVSYEECRNPDGEGFIDVDLRWIPKEGGE